MIVTDVFRLSCVLVLLAGMNLSCSSEKAIDTGREMPFTSLPSPSDVYFSWAATCKNGNVPKLKTFYSEAALGKLVENARFENQSLDEYLSGYCARFQAQTLEIRNEKIHDDRATIDYSFDSDWSETAHFIREEKMWKIAFPNQF